MLWRAEINGHLGRSIFGFGFNMISAPFHGTYAMYYVSYAHVCMAIQYSIFDIFRFCEQSGTEKSCLLCLFCLFLVGPSAYRLDLSDVDIVLRLNIQATPPVRQSCVEFDFLHKVRLRFDHDRIRRILASSCCSCLCITSVTHRRCSGV